MILESRADLNARIPASITGLCDKTGNGNATSLSGTHGDSGAGNDVFQGTTTTFLAYIDLTRLHLFQSFLCHRLM